MTQLGGRRPRGQLRSRSPPALGPGSPPSMPPASLDPASQAACSPASSEAGPSASCRDHSRAVRSADVGVVIVANEVDEKILQK